MLHRPTPTKATSTPSTGHQQQPQQQQQQLVKQPDSTVIALTRVQSDITAYKKTPENSRDLGALVDSRNFRKAVEVSGSVLTSRFSRNEIVAIQSAIATTMDSIRRPGVEGDAAIDPKEEHAVLLAAMYAQKYQTAPAVAVIEHIRSEKFAKQLEMLSGPRKTIVNMPAEILEHLLKEFPIYHQRPFSETCSYLQSVKVGAHDSIAFSLQYLEKQIPQLPVELENTGKVLLGAMFAAEGLNASVVEPRSFKDSTLTGFGAGMFTRVNVPFLHLPTADVTGPSDLAHFEGSVRSAINLSQRGLDKLSQDPKIILGGAFLSAATAPNPHGLITRLDALAQQIGLTPEDRTSLVTGALHVAARERNVAALRELESLPITTRIQVDNAFLDAVEAEDYDAMDLLMRSSLNSAQFRAVLAVIRDPVPDPDPNAQSGDLVTLRRLLEGCGHMIAEEEYDAAMIQAEHIYDNFPALNMLRFFRDQQRFEERRAMDLDNEESF